MNLLIVRLNATILMGRTIMDEIPLFIQIIGGIIALIAVGAALSIIILMIAFMFWLVSIPLKLIGILPGIWWGRA